MPLVARVPHFNGDYLPQSVNTAVDLLGGLDLSIRSGDKVLIKPNFNCSFALPLATDLAFLSAIIELLQDHNVEVSIGEMCGKANSPTDDVIARLGVMPVLKRYSVPFINFQHDEWVEVEIPGNYFKTLHVPRSIYEFDRRVYSGNMRTHNSARFTASLKLGVGFISGDDRTFLHSDQAITERKVADVNLAWQPDLVFIDGRRSTITRYGRGPYVYPNIIMASGDMVALDTEAVKELQKFEGDNALGVPLEEIPQLTLSQAHGIGSMKYILREAPARIHTEENSIF
jgi:uncharacterized protein (DUF362 family)